MDRTITYNEALVTFRDLLEPLDENDGSEYMRGGVGLMADLFGIAHMDTGERVERISDDLRRIPAFAKPDDLAQYGVEPYVNCEGCDHCRFPGIRWPASPDGFADLSYVDRCDYCERYENDETAAKHLAEIFGVRWGYARREADPKTEADIRWAPDEDDGLDYTGWSAFIDRPERDA